MIKFDVILNKWITRTLYQKRLSTVDIQCLNRVFKIANELSFKNIQICGTCTIHVPCFKYTNNGASYILAIIENGKVCHTVVKYLANKKNKDQIRQ